MLMELVGHGWGLSCLGIAMKSPLQLLAVVIVALAIGVSHAQQLANSYSIHGKVLDSQTGSPIARVLVTLQDKELRLVVTDNDGRFEFEGIHTEPAQLRLAKRGYFLPGEESPTTMSNTSLLVNSHTESIVLKLDAASTIHGRIISEEGEALETVPITLFYRKPINGEEFLLRNEAIHTNEDGEFSFSQLRAGKYFILAGPMLGTPLMPVAHSKIPVVNFGAAYYPGVSDPHAAAPIVLGPGQDISIDLSLKKISLFTLSGEITGWHAGEEEILQISPVSGAYSNYDSKFDDATGHFQASKVPSGVYAIRVFVKNSLVARQEINVHSNVAGVKLPLFAPRKIAVMVHAKDRRAEGAYVNVMLSPEDKWQQSAVNLPQPSNDPGGIFVQEPEPGKYWAHFGVHAPVYVVAATCGATDLLREPLVVTDQSVPSMDVTVAYDSATFGVQVHSQGLPVLAHVLIVPVDPPGEPIVLTTSLEGRFEGRQLAPGTYRVWAFDKLPRLYRNAAILEPYASAAKIIVLTANQTTDMQLEMVTLKAGDANE
jgi:hypothetical protein